MAEIEVATVPVGIVGQAHTYDVLIDGEARGSLKSGETRAFHVVPGIHTVRLATATTSPPPVKVVVFGTTSLLCQTQAKRRFGLFPTGAPHTTIVVREKPDTAGRDGAITWRPREDEAPLHDLLAAD